MATDQARAFGRLLKRYREAAGQTQEALAARAGVSARAISDLERGLSRAPRSATLTLLAQALELSAADCARLQAAATRSTGTAPPVAMIHSASPQPPLVGRVRELALLERQLVEEGPPLLLLTGQPGIGKSRLLQEAARCGASLGWCVLVGGCTRAGGQQPFAPLLQAVSGHLAARSAGERRLALRGCAWLVRLLPELAADEIEPLPAWTLSPEQERRLMFNAVRRLLANVATPAGTLLLLDDLQWAGSDAFDLLAALLQQPPAAPFRVVGAYRDTEVAPDHALTATVAELAEAQLVTLRHLRSLAQHEAEELFAQIRGGQERVSPALAAQAVQRVGGVPFFLVSYARGLEGEADPEAGQPELPWDLRQSLQRRLLALPESGRALVTAAAVVGRVASRRLLLAVLDQPEAAVLDALEAACRAGLLEEAGEDTYSFGHDVIREVAESELGQGRRALLHRRVAEALERQPGGAPAEVLAYHYGRGGEQVQALRYREQAGDEARAQAAHGAAEGHYREVVARLDGLGRVTDAARVQEKLGAVLTTTAQYDAALVALEQAARVYHAAGDLESEGRVTAQIGWSHAQRGTPLEGVDRIRPLLGPLEARGPSESLVALYVALARLAVLTARPSEELVVGARAEALARQLGDKRLLAAAAGRYGLALLHVGEWDAGFRMLDEAARLAEEVGDIFTLCRALANAAESGYMHIGEFGMAGTCLERARRAAERLGDPTQIASISCMRGNHAVVTGDWSQAQREFAQALTLSRRIGASWVLADVLFSLCHLHLCKGEWEEASGYLQEYEAIGERDHHRQVVVNAGGLRAALDLLQGHPAKAVARLLPLLQEETVGGTGHIVLRLVQAYLDLGDAAQAAALATEAIAHCRAANDRLCLADGLRIRAAAAVRLHSWVQAAADVHEGLLLARRIPYPYAEAWLLEVDGELQAAQGVTEMAREGLTAALAIFRRLGARKDVERTTQVVAALV